MIGYQLYLIVKSILVEPGLGKTELQTFPSPGLTTINITMNTPIPSKKY